MSLEQYLEFGKWSANVIIMTILINQFLIAVK